MKKMLRTDTMLHIIDLRTPPPENCLRSSVPHDKVECLTQALRSSNGELWQRWRVRLAKPFYTVQGLPGAFAGNYESDLGGIHFTVSTLHDEPCLLGWIACHAKVVSEMWHNIIGEIEQLSKSDPSLCPMEEPESPESVPWVASLRMTPWRQLSEDERTELRAMRAWIGWSVIEDHFSTRN